MKLDKRFSRGSLSNDPARLEEIEENALTYYQGIARLLGGQYYEQDHLIWFTTGRRSLLRFNGVLRTTVPGAEDLNRTADPVLDVFLSQNLPFFWVAWPGVSTPGLRGYLNAKGIPFTIFSLPLMTRALHDLPPVFLPPEVEIRRVQTPQDQIDWLNVFMAGFEEPEPTRPDFQQILTRSLTEPHPVFEHFLARWQGEPCATSTLLHAKHLAGIYHVTTIPAYRGRGLGKALTLTAMQSAQNAGYLTAILAATPSGFPLYQRLGFETASTADLFCWNGSG